VIVEGLCGAWKVKNNPQNIHPKYCEIKREIYWNYRDSSKRPWKINIGKREG
jgi:hypothetical protein